MTGDILLLLGGIGLFLFGMETMTDALRKLAGGGLRQLLSRFTTTPVSGVVTGMIATAISQSSTATTMTTIGFVGAGLLSFHQAVGVIFGANIGTTTTGWIVVFGGFKLQFGTIALPLLLAASLMHLLGGKSWGRWGTALAGFCLIFIGLDMMQSGTLGFEGRITPADLPGDTLWGRIQLVFIGIIAVTITQSSTAAMATALVLLAAGTINFPQGAAMAIGFNVGSSLTALLVTIGGSRAMRQTAFAHVFYNLATGIIAFIILRPMATLIHDVLSGGDDQLALVIYHTVFNVMGVVLLLPLIGPFTRFIEWLLPEAPDPLSEVLDPHLLNDPDAALDATGAASQAITGAMFDALGAALQPRGSLVALGQVGARTQQPLGNLEQYLAQILVPQDNTRQLDRYTALLHQYDHLQRLRHRCTQEAEVITLLSDPMLRRHGLVLGEVLRRYRAGADPIQTEARLERLQQRFESHLARYRQQVLRSRHFGEASTAQMFARTTAIRWLQRSTAHAQRIVHYQNRAAD